MGRSGYRYGGGEEDDYEVSDSMSSRGNLVFDFIANYTFCFHCWCPIIFLAFIPIFWFFTPNFPYFRFLLLLLSFFFLSFLARGLSRPSTSPSKVGSLMWGSETPLGLKGQVPHTALSGTYITFFVISYVLFIFFVFAFLDFFIFSVFWGTSSSIFFLGYLCILCQLIHSNLV